ncbi:MULTISPECIES: D-Ala-D-Ala carboxypeptidase family metallohydrolase [unclassified Sinorhizobium]|uniref:D-Ala-D-Ala carboxypeptidase family metallohydrolase n=1 Tax=unclassified Sinorhizobium TaxID=2613772 RepID=UPI0024C32EA0|nr:MULTISPECIES: D-Ala-D-Ala carboxypeptidase family metallohydrolase [unclassified Sinorhizobium]MDK1372862.1 D-Ala-D-Ala carboxypeptidase family metallohydrolase [Sinorhizobium sp. 6-70]MDK1477132.1 D-Ala-D-Ala carboxypeptidase family metallohydrolase [Sinorhizobium sp. 6-117]MDK1477199.1 D-Ala-D-Ala carboxypeptidase family metallohydrolase [Sinorhizobium sp. 6-117]
MQHLEGKCAFVTFGRAAALSVSLFALAGCMSSAGDEVASLKPQQSATPTQAATESGEAQTAADSGTAVPQATGVAAQTDPAATQQSLTMQSTGLRAASSSIYGQTPTATADGQTDANQAAGAARGNAVLTQPTAVNATNNSLFSNGQTMAEPAAPPQEGANNETQAEEPTVAGAAASEPATDADLPLVVPLPLSAQAALSGKVPVELQPVEVASVDPATLPQANPGQPVDPAKKEGETQQRTKTWTLASLFAPKRKEKPRSDGEPTVQQTQKKTITASDASQPQVASLAYSSLPGVNMNPLFSMEHEDHVADEEDAPVQTAALSGLARLAPNGLVLQTERVETGCFRPELLEMLKTVERHYGQKVMVTSGLRAIKVNRKRQSLHTRCAAADIQVKGVNKWELASFLRSIPGRGGVGTYCHTESVHIDIGPERDWNWRCRRRKS